MLPLCNRLFRHDMDVTKERRNIAAQELLNTHNSALNQLLNRKLAEFLHLLPDDASCTNLQDFQHEQLLPQQEEQQPQVLHVVLKFKGQLEFCMMLEIKCSSYVSCCPLRKLAGSPARAAAAAEGRGAT